MSRDADVAAYVDVSVSEPRYLIYIEFEGRWSEASPFIYTTVEDAEARIAEYRRHGSEAFSYRVVQRHYATNPGSLRFRLGCLLLYGRATPPESVVMLDGQVQVWNRGDRDEMFRIFDTIRDALGQDRA